MVTGPHVIGENIRPAGCDGIVDGLALPLTFGFKTDLALAFDFRPVFAIAFGFFGVLAFSFEAVLSFGFAFGAVFAFAFGCTTLFATLVVFCFFFGESAADVGCRAAARPSSPAARRKFVTVACDSVTGGGVLAVAAVSFVFVGVGSGALREELDGICLVRVSGTVWILKWSASSIPRSPGCVAVGCAVGCGTLKIFNPGHPDTLLGCCRMHGSTKP